MTEFEKAIRYLCFAKAENDETRICRYQDIENMVYADTELIKKYAKNYEKLVDLLCS